MSLLFHTFYEVLRAQLQDAPVLGGKVEVGVVGYDAHGGERLSQPAQDGEVHRGEALVEVGDRAGDAQCQDAAVRKFVLGDLEEVCCEEPARLQVRGERQAQQDDVVGPSGPREEKPAVHIADPRARVGKLSLRERGGEPADGFDERGVKLAVVEGAHRILLDLAQHSTRSSADDETRRGAGWKSIG